MVRLRRRGDTWPWYRTASFLLGIVVMVWITQGGPAIYGMVTFSGHMVEHMMIVMLAPLPITFGAPVTLALRALAPRTDGTRGPREWLRVIVESRFLGFLSNPIVAAVNFAGSLFIFYYSPLFEFALRNHVGHLAMIVHFTLAGYLFANALVGIDPGPKRPGYPLRVVLLFATMAFHAFFGVSLLRLRGAPRAHLVWADGAHLGARCDHRPAVRRADRVGHRRACRCWRSRSASSSPGGWPMRRKAGARTGRPSVMTTPSSRPTTRCLRRPPRTTDGWAEFPQILSTGV
ncbi:cytochrome c oxidase assembly protein [Demequina litorisediminis]|uniref:cytochrome c oxidase assembly protein n=1 Tax=Demequina litorisediminis TaxID=1849022 RepID=UPI0024E1728D|nr:cytochrome c oxidase assembly protein [Demequina litorisediminis]